MGCGYFKSPGDGYIPCCELCERERLINCPAYKNGMSICPHGYLIDPEHA